MRSVSIRNLRKRVILYQGFFLEIANPILLQKKYSRVIECLAKQQGISLDFFYHSEVYPVIRDGVSDMHCMSDAYLAEGLKQ